MSTTTAITGPAYFPEPRVVVTGPQRRSGTLVRLLAIAVGGALVVLAVGLAAISLPRVFGWKSLLVESGSMRGTYPAGTIVVARPVPADHVQQGDVILAHRGNDSTVLHRVVDIEHEDGDTVVRTKGDANPEADPDPYTLPASVPVAAFGIPLLGYLVALATTPLGWVLLVLLPATLIAAFALVRIWSD